MDLQIDNEKNITVKEMNYLSNYGYYEMKCNQLKQTNDRLNGIPMLIGWLLRIPDHGYDTCLKFSINMTQIPIVYKVL